MLRPGGGLAIYDMYLVPGGPVGAWLHTGYAARNNEPFAASFTHMDLQAELAALGFEDIDIQIAEIQRADLSARTGCRRHGRISTRSSRRAPSANRGRLPEIGLDHFGMRDHVLGRALEQRASEIDHQDMVA